MIDSPIKRLLDLYALQLFLIIGETIFAVIEDALIQEQITEGMQALEIR